jgi:hypothetical protein
MSSRLAAVLMVVSPTTAGCRDQAQSASELEGVDSFEPTFSLVVVCGDRLHVVLVTDVDCADNVVLASAEDACAWALERAAYALGEPCHVSATPEPAMSHAVVLNGSYLENQVSESVWGWLSRCGESERELVEVRADVWYAPPGSSGEDRWVVGIEPVEGSPETVADIAGTVRAEHCGDPLD